MTEETKPVAAPAATPAHAPAQPVTPTVVTAIPPAFVAERDADRGRIASLEQELAQLRAKHDEESKHSKELKDAAEQLSKKVHETESERAKAIKEAKETRLTAALRELALRHDVVDVDDFVALTREKLTFDDGGAIVLASDPKITVDVFADSFLKAKPHLLKPRVARGSGTPPISPSGVGNAAAIDLSTNEGLTAYARNLTVQRLQPRKVG